MSVTINGTNGITFPNSTTQVSAGQVLQVVNATYSTFVSSNTGTFVDSGLTASITPKFSTSKILIIVNQNGLYRSSGNSGNRLDLKLQRNGSDISSFAFNYMYTATQLVVEIGTASTTYLDSPSTTSSVTYKTQIRNGAGSADLVGVQSDSSISNITLMEIAA